jgi:hypothetical protein
MIVRNIASILSTKNTRAPRLYFLLMSSAVAKKLNDS